MQQEHFEQWTRACQTMNKPITDLSQLNATTLSDIYSESSIWMNELAKAKRPEDLMNAQVKLAMKANSMMMEYVQQAVSIMTSATTDMSKNYSNYSNEVVKSGTSGFASGKGKSTDSNR